LGVCSVYCRCIFEKRATSPAPRHPKFAALLEFEHENLSGARRASRSLVEGAMIKKKGVPGDDEFGVIPDDEADDYEDGEDEFLEGDDDLEDDEFEDEDEEEDDEFDEDFEDDEEFGEEDDVDLDDFESDNSEDES
ncbi:MAG: hypothetical protein ACRDL7_09540, partial [Gaiellaceae bacterium]